jgi:hypothetical protein
MQLVPYKRIGEPEDVADCAAPAPLSVLICRYRGISLI